VPTAGAPLDGNSRNHRFATTVARAIPPSTNARSSSTSTGMPSGIAGLASTSHEFQSTLEKKISSTGSDPTDETPRAAKRKPAGSPRRQQQTRHGYKAKETARTASEHNLSARLSLSGPRDELRELADTYDEMLGRLEAAFEGQQWFIANASHELRTPLTVMRATVDVVLAKPEPAQSEVRMGHSIRAAVDHSEALIDALLTLARNERGLTVREEVDLATVAEDVLDSIDPGDRQVHASLQPAVTSGDPVLLARLVANLVDNAVRHNVAGGNFWLTTSTVDGRATLMVTNTGPLIVPDAVDSMFEPFRRLHDRTSGDGFGLGLAIVASIAAVHGGTVAAHAVPEGGLKITVTMPSTAAVSDVTLNWPKSPYAERRSSSTGSASLPI
jgi:signal transduction histidine kinase